MFSDLQQLISRVQNKQCIQVKLVSRYVIILIALVYTPTEQHFLCVGFLICYRIKLMIIKLKVRHPKFKTKR